VDLCNRGGDSGGLSDFREDCRGILFASTNAAHKVLISVVIIVYRFYIVVLYTYSFFI
jgi:hypothetical protein